MFCFSKNFLLIFRIFTCFIVSIFILAQVVDVCADESPGGFNTDRIEEEDKMMVPLDKMDEVWNYLNERYIKSNNMLSSIDPLLEASMSEEEFFDTYFDTADLKFFATQGGVRYRKRKILSDHENKKNNLELIQIKKSGISNNPTDRTEIKFPVEPPVQKNSLTDLHPLLGLTSGQDRTDLETRLNNMDVNPLSLKPVLTLRDYRKRIYITRDGQPFITISLDRVVSTLMWLKVDYGEIEYELNEMSFTSGDVDTRIYLQKVNDTIISDLKNNFPYIQQDLSPKYNKIFEKFNDQLPGLKFLFRINLLDNYSFFLMVLFFLILFPVGLLIWYYRWKNKKNINLGI